MKEMKYVVVEGEQSGELLFVFPKEVSHAHFVEALCTLRQDKGRGWYREYRDPVSAGFTDGVSCYGRSETLDLAHRPEDALLLANGGQKDKPLFGL